MAAVTVRIWAAECLPAIAVRDLSVQTACANAAAVILSVVADMKKNNLKNKTKYLAIAAMLSALGVVIMLLGAVISVLDLTMVALASIIVFFSILEMGSPYQYLIYAATSLLSILLLPDKVSAVLYIVFGGIYPMLKRMLEKLPIVLSWVLKAVYFNLVLVATVYGAKFLFGVEEEKLTIALFLLGNAAFFLYDIAMTRLITYYLLGLRKKLRIEKYFKK